MTTEDSRFDIAIVGAGIAGASIAFFAAPHRKVLLLEAESAAGYHATGRSAAIFTEFYGPPSVRALTRASRSFFDSPPAGFAPGPLLHRRGAMFVGSEDQRDEVADFFERLSAENSKARMLEGSAVRDLVPVLKTNASRIAVLDDDAFDIDVDQVLQGFIKGARANGAVFEKNAEVASMVRDGAEWRIEGSDQQVFYASCIVNCAGAWVDEIAASAGLPGVGIEPKRRSAFVFEPPAEVEHEKWPAVIAIDESWYFKPDAGQLLGSPANADLVRPHDVVADDLDIAIGIHNIEEATTLDIGRPRGTWAGLRSFVADGEPVCGFDADAPAFFWAAAIGGYGIQMSPALGRMCASLLISGEVPEDIVEQGLNIESLSPGRAGLSREPS